MTDRQIREKIRGLQIQRAENITSIAIHNSGKTLKQMQVGIKQQNQYFDEKVEVLLSCLECDCKETRERVLKQNGF